ncbi:MAG: putative membrane protein SpoIIM required for sporulation [Candidatus Azotimanducaceae bacterium]|jgi:uncharacterized membrane protein SpoIIM required for sporulation
MESILVPITLFLMIATVIWLVVYFKFRTRQELQITVRDAVAAGNSLSGEALENLMAALQPKRSDLRRGLLWMALALAIGVFAIAINDTDATGPVLGVAAFPFFIGLAYFLLWRLGGDK